VETEQDRWVKFFKDGAKLDPDHLPPWMDTPEMRQAMSTLNSFSEKENAYYAYQARLEYQRVQRAMQQDVEERDRALEQARAELEQSRAAEINEREAKEQEREAKEQEREAKERALAEVERLRRQLDDR